MLYGESAPAGSPPREEPRRGSQPSPAERQHHQHRPEPTHWCVLVRENGAMEVRRGKGVGAGGREVGHWGLTRGLATETPNHLPSP